MGMYDKCPCKGCVPPERGPGCHSTCGKYREWQEKVADAKEKIEKEKRDRHYINSFNADGFWRMQRILHGRYRFNPRNMKG